MDACINTIMMISRELVHSRARLKISRGSFALEKGSESVAVSIASLLSRTRLLNDILGFSTLDTIGWLETSQIIQFSL